MFFFWKIWRDLFSWNTRFEIDKKLGFRLFFYLGMRRICCRVFVVIFIIWCFFLMLLAIGCGIWSDWKPSSKHYWNGTKCFQENTRNCTSKYFKCEGAVTTLLESDKDKCKLYKESMFSDVQKIFIISGGSFSSAHALNMLSKINFDN